MPAISKWGLIFSFTFDMVRIGCSNPLFDGEVMRLHGNLYHIRRCQSVDGQHPQGRTAFQQDHIILLPDAAQVFTQDRFTTHGVHQRNFQARQFNIGGQQVYALCLMDAPHSRKYGLVRDDKTLSAPVRFCNFSPNVECKKMAGKDMHPLNNYTCRFRPSSLKCTDKSGLDGLQADK